MNHSLLTHQISVYGYMKWIFHEIEKKNEDCAIISVDLFLNCNSSNGNKLFRFTENLRELRNRSFLKGYFLFYFNVTFRQAFSISSSSLHMFRNSIFNIQICHKKLLLLIEDLEFRKVHFSEFFVKYKMCTNNGIVNRC